MNELALKYLILESNKKFKNIHRLNILFETLDENQKQEIKTETIKNCGFISFGDFDTELEDSSENFVKLRYFFEKNRHDLNVTFLKGFKKALINKLK